MLTRFHNWEELLHEYLLRRQNEKFAWGQLDCCTFACDWVLEATGVDPMAEMRGQYSGSITAQKAMLRRLAARTLARAAERIATQHQLQEVPPLMAQRGDIVLIELGQFQALGIVGLHGHQVHAPSPDRIISLSIDPKVISRAWRI